METLNSSLYILNLKDICQIMHENTKIQFSYKIFKLDVQV